MVRLKVRLHVITEDEPDNRVLVFAVESESDTIFTATMTYCAGVGMYDRRGHRCRCLCCTVKAISLTMANLFMGADRIHRIWAQVKETSEFEERRRAIRAWNEANEHAKRGIAITPVKFGISFTATFFNQAGALVLVYRDGSVQVNHGVSYRVDIGDMDPAFRQRK